MKKCNFAVFAALFLKIFKNGKITVSLQNCAKRYNFAAVFQ